MTTQPEPPIAAPERKRRFGDLELLIVVLLGVVSVATAYTSFQAALYDGMTASAYSQAQNAQTEAESLFLEANQRYIQDTQTWARMTELSVEMSSSDAAVADLAEAKFDTLHFVLVDEAFDQAIAWSEEENAAGGEYVGPFQSDDYLTARFGGWSAEDQRSLELFEEADEYDTHGDRLQLNTVLMAISLFLLGVAAVVKRERVKWLLIGFAMLMFLVAVILTALVPFVWI